MFFKVFRMANAKVAILRNNTVNNCFTKTIATTSCKKVLESMLWYYALVKKIH